MREKTADAFYGFCVGAGGMCIALLYRVDVFPMLFVFLLCFVGWLIYSKIYFTQSVILCVGALFSASVSVYVGCKLVCRFAIDSSFLPMCVLLGGGCAIILALSDIRASKSVAFVVSLVCIFLMLLILFLCIVESDLSKEKFSFLGKRLVIPLTVFSVVDSFFIMPYIKNKNRIYFMIGNSVMPFYMLVTIAVSVCALSRSVFESLDSPVVKLWQTCYVLSFVDRFETLIICALFSVCVVKAGVLLKSVFDFCSQKTAVLFFALVVLLFVSNAFMYVFAALSLFCVAIYCIIKKIC